MVCAEATEIGSYTATVGHIGECFGSEELQELLAACAFALRIIAIALLIMVLALSLIHI